MKPTREEVIQMARDAGGETRYFSLDRVEGFSFFTIPEFERFAQACYRQGVDDSIKQIMNRLDESLHARLHAGNLIRALLGDE